MTRLVRSLAVVCGVGLSLTGPSPGQDGLEPPRASRERGLVFTAPEGWRPAEPIEPERAAWSVRPGGGGPSLRVILYRHTARRPLDARVAEWARSFEGADGSPLAPAAATREDVAPRDAEGVTGVLVELRGAFTGALEPGAEERARREGWVALHAVLEGPDGTWVASGVGPAAVVDQARTGFLALLRAARAGLVAADAPPRTGDEVRGADEAGEDGEDGGRADRSGDGAGDADRARGE